MLGGPEERAATADRRAVEVEEKVAPQLSAQEQAGVVDENPRRPVAGKPHAHAPALRRRAVQPEGQGHAEAVDVRGPAQLGNGNLGNRLEPDRLPDAGGAVIPDIAGLILPVLFAPGLLQVPGLVLGAHDDHLDLAGDEQGRDLGRERRLPARVLDRQAAVDPDGRLVVDRAEVEEKPTLAVGPIDADFTAVPHHRVKAGFMHPRQLALGREGHGDFAIEGFRPIEPALGHSLILVIEGKAPGAAQVDPALATQLRARMQLGLRIVGLRECLGHCLFRSMGRPGPATAPAP